MLVLTHLVVCGALRGREDGRAEQAWQRALPQAHHAVSLRAQGERTGEEAVSTRACWLIWQGSRGVDD